MAQIALTTWNSEVYEPSDDSFALVDALQEQLPRLLADSGPPRTVLEIGCGSGYVICSAALALRAAGASAAGAPGTAAGAPGAAPGAPGTAAGAPGAAASASEGSGAAKGAPGAGEAAFWAVDLNPRALEATAATLKAHGVGGVELVRCDLLRPLARRLAGGVDLLLFNPPYVPTPDEEVERDGIARAWAGGHRGRRVIDRLLPQVPAATQEQLSLLRARLEGLLAYMQEHAAEVFLPPAAYVAPDDPAACPADGGGGGGA
ncbi:hemK methyltransferase family member-like [Raphidocelis subcapitata]|uniref:HemK methyltransferase family member-like n=1 Tax=Raphidocelis subcapitata TaxID=307507 RepID=A0A2V0P2H2_9CHLO|nr:hemK methyltransferase family member-like [Raphidocelis subcapitata]|eukprot:GBF93092.1 hemK methyltransferase family member-like [Raphidocelis subcapitata]